MREKRYYCKHCGANDHVNKSSKLCVYNDKQTQKDTRKLNKNNDLITKTSKCTEESKKRAERRIRESSTERLVRLEKQKVRNRIQIENNSIASGLSVMQNDFTRTIGVREMMSLIDLKKSSSKNIVEEFELRKQEYPTHECVCCSRIFYIDGILKGSQHLLDKLLNISLKTNIQEFLFFDYELITPYFCHTCVRYLNKEKLPKFHKFNKMYPGDIPTEISQLSCLEISLISQIRPYMKIYSLKSGRLGQYSLKGSVTHFAQCVEEINEQLPLRTCDLESIVVTESLVGINSEKKFLIRPKLIYEALKWLKVNNILYQHVQIVERNNEELSLEALIVLNERRQSKIITDSESFKIINENTSIIHGSFHQGVKSIMGNESGSQCTAMAMIAIAYAYVTNIKYWNTDSLNNILFKGNEYYKKCLAKNGYDNTEFLEPREVEGIINIINDKEIHCKCNTDNGEIYSNLISKANIKNSLVFLLGNNFLSCIFTASGYSFAIIKRDNSLYLFNSHSCSAIGNKSQNGKCCLIQYTNIFENAGLEKISNHLFKLVKCDVKTDEQQNQFTIMPIETQLIGNNTFGEIKQVEDIEIIRENDEEELQEYIETALCSVDIAHPNVTKTKEIISSFKLTRKTCKPINESSEERLEELSFLKLFPYGFNGFEEERLNENLSISEYVKVRLLNKDCRYQNIEYLFYLLCKLEEEKVKKNVNICASRMRRENELIYDLHSSMKSLRGYATYWDSSRGDLLAMNRTLGPPTWFISLSSRDLEWPDMLKALELAKRQVDPTFTVGPDSSYEVRSSLLKEFPVVAARHFHRRLNRFMELLLKDENILVGKITDHWYRIEFQARGSPHVHMLLWVANCPKFDTLEGIELIEKVISCCKSTGDPELDKLVERLQKHLCKFTCFKRENNVCRFGFPHKESNVTRILGDNELLSNNGKFCILKRTNEELNINNYNSTILKMWQANMDIQPVGTMFGVAYYIAKYCSKEEDNGIRHSIKDALDNIKKSQKSELSHRIYKACKLFINQRERSAQEAAYILCGFRLKMCSRSCVFINSRPPIYRSRMLKKEYLQEEDLEEEHFCSDIFDKYQRRPQNLERLCLYEFASEYRITYSKAESMKISDDERSDEDSEFETEKPNKSNEMLLMNSKLMSIKKRKRPAIVKTPSISVSANEDEYYYSILVLFVPFRLESNLLLGYENVKDALEANKTNFRTNISENLSQKQEEINNALERLTLFRNENELFANSTNEVEDLIEVEQNDAFDLEIDRITKKHVVVEELSLLQRIKNLNIEQREIYVKMRDHIRYNKEQKLVIIHGYGGTGKSFLSKIIEDTVHLHESRNGETCVLVCAPTGVAAKNIGGVTCHSAFRLPIQKFTYEEFTPLKGKVLNTLRMIWKSIKWCIIDEISMISYTQLRQINLRLQQFKENDNIFGGISVILMGDLLQLKPCKGENRIFEQPKKFETEVNLWNQFEFCELKINQRQKGDKIYGEMCCRVREGKTTPEDLRILESRLINNVTEKDEFYDCVWIYATRKCVELHNKKMFEEMIHKTKTDCFDIEANDVYNDGTLQGKRINKNDLYSEEDKCGGLPSHIKLSIGCRVMLRRNIDVSRGLVNGSLGTVTGFDWPCLRRNQKTKGEIPECVNVKFDDKNISKEIVKIYPVTITFQAKSGKVVSRTMIPLILSWAVTIHKMQGITLEKAVIDLYNGFEYGMEYVALSRVKSLNGLAISRLKYDRFKNNKYTCPKALAEILRRTNKPNE